MSRHAIYNACCNPKTDNLLKIKNDFLKAIHEGCGIIAINEAYTKEYRKAIEEVAHKHKRLVIWGKGGVGLAYRSHKWQCRKWKWHRYHRGIKGFTPERGCLDVTLWNKEEQQLETYDLTHMINGGFNKKPLIFKRLRPKMWNKGWSILQGVLEDGEGLRMVLGDINRQARDTPKPHSNARLRTPGYEIMQIWTIGNWGYRDYWNIPVSQLKWADHAIQIISTSKS